MHCHVYFRLGSGAGRTLVWSALALLILTLYGTIFVTTIYPAPPLQHLRGPLQEQEATREVRRLYNNIGTTRIPQLRYAVELGNELAQYVRLRGDPLTTKATRRLNKAPNTTPQRGNALDYHPYLHHFGLVIFAIIWCALGAAIGHMRRSDGGNDGTTHGPYWDPAGNVPFREYVYEINA